MIITENKNLQEQVEQMNNWKTRKMESIIAFPFFVFYQGNEINSMHKNI